MGESNGTRRAPRKLSAEQKWEVFLQVTTKELTQAEAACKWRVDVSTVPADGEGRGAGRAVPTPGAAGGGAELRAGGCSGRDRRVDRGGQGPGHRAGRGSGKSRLGLLGPLAPAGPGRGEGAVLKTVDDAVAAGFCHTWATSLWQVSDDRVHRWRARRLDVGTLEDLAPGARCPARPAPMGRSCRVGHRRAVGQRRPLPPQARPPGLLHRQVWVSPATVWQILCRHHLILDPPPPRQPAPRSCWPDWLEWAPNRVWCWDATHFTRAKRAAFAIVDVVSRKWIATVVTAEESSTRCSCCSLRLSTPGASWLGPTSGEIIRCCWPCPTTVAR